jgi:cadmium resistance protein CadD (predicted permease)
MSSASPPTPPGVSDPLPHEQPASPRVDFFSALGWIALGAAVLIASLMMDRLEKQHINPYTIPGLLPALLGIAMIVLGGVLALRSWRQGALAQPAAAPSADQRDERRRIWIVMALCVGYGAVLIGHGLPFWLASTIYVTASILIVQRLSRDAEQRRMSARAIAKALLIGVLASLITQWVFQDLFLVRLP